MPQPEEFLRTFLADRDEACPGCGYNLRALPGTRCPECNQELVIRVSLAEPRMAWFVGGVVGITMGFGFCSMVLGWALYITLRRNMGNPRMHELIPLMVGTVIGAALLIGWIRARRRLNGARPEARWGAALAVSGLALICPFWFFTTVR